MGSVSILFHAERWVAQWRAVGGFVTVAPGRIGTGGAEIHAPLEMAPTFPLVEAWDSPRRHRAAHLRAALAMHGARDRVIDYLALVDARRGWGSWPVQVIRFTA